MNIAYNMDCMVAMREMKDKEFDLAIVDPPYGIGDFSQRHNRPYNRGEKIKWNKSIPEENYFSLLHKISKNHIVFGFQHYMKYLWDDLRGVIIHDFGSVGGYASDADIAITNLQNRVVQYKYRWQGFIRENQKETDRNRIHPCEKPVALYKWLLKNYAKEGDRILDTHLGGGSSRIACYEMGFDFVGYEIDKDYFDAQEKRFKEPIKQRSLFQPKEMYRNIKNNEV